MKKLQNKQDEGNITLEEKIMITSFIAVVSISILWLIYFIRFNPVIM